MVPVLARVASAFVGASGWTPCGYASLEDFARERLGRSGRWARDLADLGSGLDRLPGLEAALLGTDGGVPLGRVVARCVARTAVAETLAEWVSWARERTVRELVDSARGARRAGSPHPLDQAPAPTGEPEPGFEPTGGVEAEDTEDLVSEVRLRLPVPIDVAVDETRDLHRAVSGRESSLASFVEALVGEVFAGPHPPDAALVPLGTGVSTAVREQWLARVNDRWRALEGDLPGAGFEVSEESMDRPASDASCEAARAPGDPSVSSRVGFGRVAARQLAALASQIESVLERVAALESEWATSDGPWVRDRVPTLAAQLEELVTIEETIERLQGQVLHAMGRHGDWSQLGFAGVGHYAEQRLGLARRTAQCRAGIVGALARLPAVRAAYESGAIGLEAAWLLVRVLGRGPVEAAIETAWVTRAREFTVKRLRDEIRHARWESSGAAAPEPASASASASPRETSAGSDLRAALDALPTSAFDPGVSHRNRRPVVPLPATDAVWQASLRRWPGRTRERVWRLGTRALHTPGAVVFRCFRLPPDLAATFLAAIESERRRLEQAAHQVPWPETWPDPQAPPSVLTAHEFAMRVRRVPAWVGLLSLLEDFARTWDDPRAFTKRRWEKTYERDNHRCVAPGCTRSSDIQDHHIDYRSDQGSDQLWNQLTLCPFHHLQGEHGRFARVRGTAPLRVTWRLGRIDLASRWRNERRLDAPSASRIRKPTPGSVDDQPPCATP